MKSTGRRFSIGLLFAAARSLCVFNIVNKSCHTSKRPFLILCHLRSKLVQDVIVGGFPVSSRVAGCTWRGVSMVLLQMATESDLLSNKCLLSLLSTGPYTRKVWLRSTSLPAGTSNESLASIDTTYAYVPNSPSFSRSSFKVLSASAIEALSGIRPEPCSGVRVAIS